MRFTFKKTTAFRGPLPALASEIKSSEPEMEKLRGRVAACRSSYAELAPVARNLISMAASAAPINQEQFTENEPSCRLRFPDSRVYSRKLEFLLSSVEKLLDCCEQDLDKARGAFSSFHGRVAQSTLSSVSRLSVFSSITVAACAFLVDLSGRMYALNGVEGAMSGQVSKFGAAAGLLMFGLSVARSVLSVTEERRKCAMVARNRLARLGSIKDSVREAEVQLSMNLPGIMVYLQRAISENK